MVAKNCLNCGTGIKQTSGKREKKFCSDKCRATFNQKKDHPATIELPKNFVGVEKMAILKADGTIEELKSVDQLPKEWQLSLGEIQKLETADRELKVKEAFDKGFENLVVFDQSATHFPSLEVGVTTKEIEQSIIKDEIKKLEKEIKDGKIMKFSSELTQKLYFHERNKKIKELKQQLINQ